MAGAEPDVVVLVNNEPDVVAVARDEAVMLVVNDEAGQAVVGKCGLTECVQPTHH